MAEDSERRERLRVLDVSLEATGFMRTLLRHLSGTLEEVVGLEEAQGFVAVVGQKMGDEFDRQYREALGQATLTQSQVASVLVDLKRRIEGDFFIVEESPRMLLLGNRRCPFGDRVLGRPSLCMMTSNVFGVIAAENLGYAKVELRETIATGHGRCLIAVYFDPKGTSEVAGREYFHS